MNEQRWSLALAIYIAFCAVTFRPGIQNHDATRGESTYFLVGVALGKGMLEVISQ